MSSNPANVAKPKSVRRASSTGAKPKPSYSSYSQRVFEISSTLTEFRSTNHFIRLDGDRHGGAAAEVRGVVGIQYPTFRYHNMGFDYANRLAFVVGAPLTLDANETRGQLVLPLCQSLLEGLGIDTAKMAPEDFVVRLPVVESGHVITHELLDKYESFAMYWVRSLRRSMKLPGSAASRDLDSPAIPEELLLESNFPWKSSK